MKETNTSQQPDWLVIFFILDVSDIINDTNSFFEAMQAIALGENTKVYVLKDSLERIRHPRRFTGHSLKVSQFVRDKKTLLRDIELEGVDRNDGKAWLRAIRQIYTATPARFSALVPWSHGAGLGFANRNTLPPPAEIAAEKTADATQKIDCTGIELYMCEIGQGLECITAEKKFDLILMSACNTQLLDNVYNLRNIARYYLAPLCGMQTIGYDFAAFIDFINRPVPVPEDQYFQRIFSLLFEGYKKLSPGDQPDEAFTVADLRFAGSIPELLNPVCDYFIANRERIYPVITKVAAHDISNLFDLELFDITALLVAIRQKAADTILDARIAAFVDFVKQHLVAAKFVGERLANKLPPAGITSCSVYLPTGDKDDEVPPGIDCQYRRFHLHAAFVTDVHWAAFIADFTKWRDSRPENTV